MVRAHHVRVRWRSLDDGCCRWHWSPPAAGAGLQTQSSQTLAAQWLRLWRHPGKKAMRAGDQDAAEAGRRVQGATRRCIGDPAAAAWARRLAGRVMAVGPPTVPLHLAAAAKKAAHHAKLQSSATHHPVTALVAALAAKALE